MPPYGKRGFFPANNVNEEVIGGLAYKSAQKKIAKMFSILLHHCSSFTKTFLRL